MAAPPHECRNLLRCLLTDCAAARAEDLGKAGDQDTVTVDGAAASAGTVHRNPLTGLYW